MKVSKTAILPVITTLFLGISYVTGHQFAKGTADMVANIAVAAITSGATIWGIWKNHKNVDNPTNK